MAKSGELDIDVLIARVEAQSQQLLAVSRELGHVAEALRKRRAEEDPNGDG
jgi:hypothetical protein